MSDCFEFLPDYAVHPVETLKDEMHYYRMSWRKLARKSGLGWGQLAGLIHHEPITMEIAAGLEKALLTPAYLWLALQDGYDKTMARLKQEQEATCPKTC